MKQRPISRPFAVATLAPLCVICGLSAAIAQSTVPGAVPPPPDNSLPLQGGNTDTVASGAAVMATPLTPQDYVNDAAIGDMFEIDSGKLALAKSQNKDVKAFASHMVQDHEASAAKLQGVIKDKNVAVVLPSRMDQAHLDLLSKLQAAQGADFDKLYVAMQLDGHRQALKLHQGYADSGDAAELKTFATVVAPMVDKHLTRIEQIAKSLNIAT
ncbi:MAG: DUF4142 domain-containing protein [Dongiaceae bacterium]